MRPLQPTCAVDGPDPTGPDGEEASHLPSGTQVGPQRSAGLEFSSPGEPAPAQSWGSSVPTVTPAPPPSLARVPCAGSASLHARPLPPPPAL